MVPIRPLNFTFGVLLLLFPHALSQGVGSCHPYPGAVAQDCLQLIGDNLQNDKELVCEKGRATITLRDCSITTKCAVGETSVVPDEIVRRALTSIGACALSDYGSISGVYTAVNGAKTCYLYPGRESFC
ncbi:hypothetical protein CPB84DRAFT_1037085 [Gymnopilus junonius]|uniref:Secreted protein n=1 Tax=Gymnopilus junonius TaxID=109634 RepID=A0A9P5N7B8_GYMJU|nr:hypothetical protein CPB84DRAFT_1037085 [Gymnopilus junonius]